MDLTTSWMGLRLAHPLMVGSSPLADDLDTVRRLEDAGAAAIVLRSLFEEQIVLEQLAAETLADNREEAYAYTFDAYEGMESFKLLPDEYLEHVQRVKAAVRIPVIASLNGVSPGGWLHFSKLLHQAGADGLELNVYFLATDPDDSAQAIEQRTIDMLGSLKRDVAIPVALKLSPFYTALAHFARQLDLAGADGLVLFNRFYQPDIDVEERTVEHTIQLSEPQELLLRLRWLAILHGRVRCSLAASGGVHGVLDAVKAVMAGADAVQVVSALMREGPDKLGQLRAGLAEWLEEHEYESLAQMRGSMSLGRCPDPKAYERANYLEILRSRDR
jgi:dihydroorotate dehydrogenase (fumarate)